VSREAMVAFCCAVVAVLLFGLAAYGTKYLVDTCEKMQCRPPLRGRLMRSTHYTNECVCVEVPHKMGDE